MSAAKGYGSEAFVDNAKLHVEYAYDANGNMTRDDNSKISIIKYNLLNLPDTKAAGDTAEQTLSVDFSLAQFDSVAKK